MPRSQRDDRDVADVATGVPSATAARFLPGYLRGDALRGDPPVDMVHHIARYGGEATESELISLIANGRAEAPAREATLLKADQQGLQERGGAPGAKTRDLALDVARTLLDSSNRDELK